jgi:NAD+ kinase
MKLGLTANPKKATALELARRALEIVGDRAEIVISDEIPHVGPRHRHAPLGEIRPEVLLAIGGDGTFLYALQRCDAPLLPINAGTIGVLAEVGTRRPGEFEGALGRLLSGRYFVEERMKLAAQVDGASLPDATNEFVIHSTPVGKMGRFEVAFDGHVAGRIRADGVIVATPTGSTAYSLSSLGPIVDPGLDAMVLTTIAPFRLEPRSVVIEPLHTLRLRPVEAGRAAVVISDGQVEFPLAPEQSVTVYRSPRHATLVRFGSRYFQRLRGKRILPWSEEFAEEDVDLADVPPPT